MTRARMRQRLSELALPVDPTSAARGRHWVVDELALEGRAAGIVALLVSELITNSLLHAGLTPDQRILVRAARDGDEVRVEVVDEGGRFDKVSASPDRRDGGWGLGIVGGLATDWGVRLDEATLVWFTYRVGPAA